MVNSFRWSVPVLVLTMLAVAESVDAQGRGRRGPPESVRTRMGAFFVDVTLPDGNADASGKEQLAATAHVKEAATKGYLSLLYVYDPEADKKKHEKFETAVFNHQGISVALRLFQCGKIDLSKDEDANAEFGKKVPLFAAFDVKGKYVGEVVMRGYKASSPPIMKLLSRAAKGYAKLPLTPFMKKYRSFLNDLTLLEGRKRTLEGKRARLDGDSGRGNRSKLAKLAKLEKDEQKLLDSEAKLFDSEKELLERAKVPPRNEKAQRVGERRRGRGRGR